MEFTPNPGIGWVSLHRFFHPRFGPIKCVRTMRRVQRDEELTVAYGYDHTPSGKSGPEVPNWYKRELQTFQGTQAPLSEWDLVHIPIETLNPSPQAQPHQGLTRRATYTPWNHALLTNQGVHPPLSLTSIPTCQNVFFGLLVGRTNRI